MLTNSSYVHLIIFAIAVALLVVVVWAVVVTIRDKSTGTPDKVVWTILLLALPVIGLGLWVIARFVKRQGNLVGPGA
jgi:uncharacterized RDD family membrane protein YckC